MKHQRITEFAASIGVSHTAVRKAINSGRIPADFVRTKELRTGRKVTVIIKPVAARDAFMGNTYRDITDSDTPADDYDSAGDIPASVSPRTWDADEVTQMVHEEYFFARTILMAIPASVAESLAACTDAEQIQTILEGTIKDALDDLTSDIDQFYASDICDISDIEPETSTPIQLTCLP